MHLEYFELKNNLQVVKAEPTSDTQKYFVPLNVYKIHMPTPKIVNSNYEITQEVFDTLQKTFEVK